MSVIYLVLVLCMDQACTEKAAYINDKFVGETVSAMGDCIKPRDAGRKFYADNAGFDNVDSVECWDRDELTAKGFRF